MTLELRTPYEADPRYNRLTPGQRALYVLSWADAEILNGGWSALLSMRGSQLERTHSWPANARVCRGLEVDAAPSHGCIRASTPSRVSRTLIRVRKHTLQ